jgi:hypothetical protein
MTRPSPETDTQDRQERRNLPPQEVDVWWGAYAGRTMLPGFGFCVLFLLVAIIAGWYCWARLGFDRLTTRYSAFALIGLVWGLQIIRWLHRTITFSYRLTNRRLLLERNFVRSGRAELGLDTITEVRALQSPIERRLGIGTLYVFAADKNLPAMVLAGVVSPDKVSDQIRSLSKHLKEKGPAEIPDPQPWTLPLTAGHSEGDM